MRRGSGAVVRRRRWVWPVAMSAGLVLAGRTLVDEVGSPLELLRALGDLGDPWAEPVAPMISLLALLAETLVAYILVAVALRSLCQLPGSVGRVAGRFTLLVTPVVLRRLLDLLVGGTLLAQATLVVSSGMPPGHRAAVPALRMITSSISSGHAAPVAVHTLDPSGTGWARLRPAVTDPVESRPAPRRSSAPLPPWLGGGPSNPTSEPTLDARPGPAGEAARGSAGKAAPRSAGETGPASRGKTQPGSGAEAEPGSSDKTGSGSSDAKEPGSTGETEPGSSGRAVTAHTVAVGDTLWDIAAAHLGSRERTVPNVHRYWRQVYLANRRAIGADPDLIHPGTRLIVPPFRRDRP